MLWAMKTVSKDFGLSHICLWNRATLEYGGLCSHCCLYEGVAGEFELSVEELETLNADKIYARAAKQSETSHNWHNHQMETNYEEYSANRAAYNAARKAKDPEGHKRWQTESRESSKAQNTYYCETCKTNCKDLHELQKHQKGRKHLPAAVRMKRPYLCIPCVFGANQPAGLNEHFKTASHKEVMASLSSSDELD